jgi:hypothetical protein
MIATCYFTVSISAINYTLIDLYPSLAIWTYLTLIYFTNSYIFRDQFYNSDFVESKNSLRMPISPSIMAVFSFISAKAYSFAFLLVSSIHFDRLYSLALSYSSFFLA